MSRTARLNQEKEMETSISDNNPWSATYWDKIGRKMDGPVFQDQIAFYKRREYLDLISTWTPSGQVKSVLKTDLFEEAFGKDSLLDVLSLSYPFAVGIDISRFVTNEAKKKFPGFPSLITDVCSLPFKEESFDFILSNSTLDHLPFSIVPNAIKELWRVLKPEGCLILTLDSKHNPFHLLSHWIRAWVGRFHTERCYTIREASALLNKGRFQITDVTAIYHIPPGINFLAKKLHKTIGPRANRFIQYLINICDKVGQSRVQFLSGRFIALRAIKLPNLEIEVEER